MIFYSDDTILIRNMKESDVEDIAEAELAQGWGDGRGKYHMRLAHQAEGYCVALVAEFQGQAVGYIHVYPNAGWGPLGGQGYPEIVDFGVLEKFRRHGVGGKLLETAETVAAEYGPLVYLAVGLHAFYGSAQRLYAKRGYVPDGSGVWYADKPCVPHEMYHVDDELNLYLVKKLR